METYFTYNDDNALVNKVANGLFSYCTYDIRGNCVSIEENDGSTYFEYNHANLVTSIKYKSGVSNYFYYDSLLRRYALEDSDGLRYFTWDNSGTKLLDERDISGDVTAYYTHGYSYVPGIGTMVAAKKQESSATYYQFPAYDHRGSVYRLTNEDNEVVATYEYNAFGEPLQNQEDWATNRMHYQSNWISLKDSGDEIVLSPSRLYSTATGQFLQKDFLLEMTLLEQQGMYWNSIFRERLRNIFQVDSYGLYIVFANNPYKYNDLSGKEVVEATTAEKKGIVNRVLWNSSLRVEYTQEIQTQNMLSRPDKEYFGTWYSGDTFLLKKTPFVAITGAKLMISANCCCFEGKWRTCGSLEIDFDLIVIINSIMIKDASDINYIKQTVEFEAEHVHDFQKWEEKGKHQASLKYYSLKDLSWESEEECKKEVKQRVFEYVNQSFVLAVRGSTSRWDSTGLHADDAVYRAQKRQFTVNRYNKDPNNRYAQEEYNKLIDSEKERIELRQTLEYISNAKKIYNELLQLIQKK